MRVGVNRLLVFASYTVAFLLVVVPLSEVTFNAWPQRWADLTWRFGAAGLYSRALLTPLLGMVLAVAIAVGLGRPRVLRLIGVLGGISAAILAILAGLFVLDAGQVRAQVEPSALLPFDVAAAQAFLKMIASIMVCGLVAVGTWREARVLDSVDHGQKRHSGLVASVRS